MMSPRELLIQFEAIHEKRLAGLFMHSLWRRTIKVEKQDLELRIVFWIGEGRGDIKKIANAAISYYPKYGSETDLTHRGTEKPETRNNRRETPGLSPQKVHLGAHKRPFAQGTERSSTAYA